MILVIENLINGNRPDVTRSCRMYYLPVPRNSEVYETAKVPKSDTARGAKKALSSRAYN